MIRYVAFLRGINVSGYRLIKMDELKELFIALGLKNVKTYIQSGNVLFDSKDASAEVLNKKIEKHLHKSLGYEVTVVLRTIEEMAEIVKNTPFAGIEADKTISIYVSFLSGLPEKEKADALMALSTKEEIVKIKNREIYYLAYRSENEKLFYSNAFAEKKLKLAATTRNWATVNKVLSM